MPATKTKAERTTDWQLWQPQSDLTCYSERNPAMPWLPATEAGFNKEDAEFAEKWARDGDLIAGNPELGSGHEPVTPIKFKQWNGILDLSGASVPTPRTQQQEQQGAT